MTGRSWYKVILALVLVVAVGASLWFSAPVRALTISFPTLPSSGTIGNDYTFTVKVDISDPELLPIQNVNLYLYKSDARATYEATSANLPLSTTVTPFTTITGTGTSGTAGTISITAVASNWGYGYGYGYAVWEGYGYHFFPPGGYGYGYGYGYAGSTASITYSVTWTPPTSWPAADYIIETKITANGTNFIESGSFTLAQQGGGGGAGGRDIVPPRLTEISDSEITETGVHIYWRTQELSTTQVEYWTSPPSLFSELNETMVLHHHVYLTDLNPAIAYHYRTMSQDQSGNLAISDEYTFTTLGTPAWFILSGLEVTPREVDIDDEVTIRVPVRNAGDAAGSYTLVLKVENQTVATREITLAGGDSQDVIFTLSQDVAGTYTIDVNGLSGEFVVKPAAVPPTPTPTPTPTPPAPTPTPTPIPLPPEGQVNWWLIGGIIAGAVAVATVVWLTAFRRSRW